MNKIDNVGFWILIFILFTIMVFLVPTKESGYSAIFSIIWLIVWIGLFVNIFVQIYRLNKATKKDPTSRRLVEQRFAPTKDKSFWIILFIYAILISFLRTIEILWLKLLIGFISVTGFMIFYRIKAKSDNSG
jgi:hypothetical protein